MDAKALLPQYITKRGEDVETSSRCRLTKPRLVAALALVLGLAAIVGACAVAALALLPPRPGSGGEGNMERDDEPMVADDQVASIARRQGPIANTLYQSCPPDESSNDTAPAAYISGRKVKWNEKATFWIPGDRPYIGYKTYWNCNSMNSYVKGGMSFRQEDQSLYFPTCGYYYISSQVLFQYSLTDNQPNQNFSARHGVEIQPNCGPYDHTRYLYSYSSLEQKEHVRASTFIGDIAKICEGGSIRIVVPERGNLCCAQGESMMTHFSTYLVEKTDCS